MNTKELLTTGDVAELLGVSRQHVVDLCSRGELSYIRVGTHRRVPAGEVSRLRGALTREQQRSLWLHGALLGELFTRPIEVLDLASQNIARWRELHRPDGMTVRYLDEWSAIIHSGVDAVAEVLTSRTQNASELRQNSPFAGALTEDTRQLVLRSFNEHWARKHEATQ